MKTCTKTKPKQIKPVPMITNQGLILGLMLMLSLNLIIPIEELGPDVLLFLVSDFMNN